MKAWKKTAAFLTAAALAFCAVPMQNCTGGTFGIAGISADALDTLAVTEISADTLSGSDLFTPADTPGFQPVSADEAAAWADVPDVGNVILIYDFDTAGAYLYVLFVDGAYQDAGRVGATKDDIAYSIRSGNRHFYTGASAEAALGDASLSLGADLGLNFYVKNVNSDTCGRYALKFTGTCDENGQTVPISPKTVGEKTYYCAAAHISADHMSEQIQAVLVKDGIEQEISKKASAMDYLNAAETDAKVQADANLLAMVQATKTYGAVSRYYFHGGTPGDLTLPETDDALLARKVSYDILPEGAKVSAVLNAKASLRLYFAGNETKGSPDGASAELMPNEMGTPQPIRIGEKTYRFSAYTWISRVLNSAESSEKNRMMAKALYGYVKAAEDLAGIPVQSVSIAGLPETINVSERAPVHAEIFPEDATDKTVIWESGDNEKLTIVSLAGFSHPSLDLNLYGEYKALKTGEVTLTATVGGKSDTCIVQIKNIDNGRTVPIVLH